jgi:tripartite motif-containing protein 71
VYGSVGIYNVTLTVTNGVGNNTLVKSGYIDVESVPSADFSASSTLGIMPLNISFTDLSTGVPTSWYWSFGDGTNSTEQNPSHTYNKVGKFTVTLTARNAVGSNYSRKIQYIDVKVIPIANFTANRTVGKVPSSVKFTDRSTGTPDSWYWDFGDGTNSTEKSPVHVYSEVGRYNVTLIAANAVGNNTTTRYGYIDVESVPVANFSANSTVGAVPFNVSFTDLSEGVPTSWSWSFGDGVTSTEQNPSHMYNKSGQYTVRLTAKNVVGINTTTKTKYITVESIPVAAFSASPYSGTAPLNVQFTDRSTGYPESWSWDFGDGSTSTEKSPVHTYSAAGRYTVNLTVTNLAGNNTKSMSSYIRVS